MVDVISNKRLIQIIFKKISEDLYHSVYHPYGAEIWIVNFETKEWYFEYTNNGRLWYNQLFFKNYFRLFSLSNSEYQKILKIWFEQTVNLPVNVISRKNSNMDYYIDGIMRNTNYKWSLNKRFGFSYQTVSHYLKLKSHILEENINLSHFFTEYEFS